MNTTDATGPGDSGASASAVPATGQPDAQTSATTFGGALKAKVAATDDNDATTITTDPSAPTAAISVEAAAGASPSPDEIQATAAPRPAAHVPGNTFAQTLLTVQNQTPPVPGNNLKPVHAAPAPPVPPEVQFSQANTDKIVRGVHTQLLPNGGSMQLRLDPADLGTMNVSVQMRDGVMTATFETSSDRASHLLSHSLGELKTALENAGVSVGTMHVRQAAPATTGGSPGGGKNSDDRSADEPAQQRDEQRREMLRKMWRRLNGGKDPLDMVA